MIKSKVEYVWAYERSCMYWWEQFDTMYLNVRCAYPFNQKVHLCELLLLKRIRQLPINVCILKSIYDSNKFQTT